MSGNNKSYHYPVMKSGDRVILDKKSKAEILAQHFVRVRSTEFEFRAIMETIADNLYSLEEVNYLKMINVKFNMGDINKS